MPPPVVPSSTQPPVLLLPPSEGKAGGGRRRTRPTTGSSGWHPGDGRFGDLEELRVEVIDALARRRGGDEKLLGVGGDHLLRALDANLSLIGAPTLPAWQRYTGVVWDHLDPSTLDARHRRCIVVVSGLLGLARADDQIPDYRLKMSSNLAPLGKLSTWWREALTSRLQRATSRRFVVDLLPQEHRAAWRPTGPIDGVRIELVDPTGKPGGHFAKAAKGALARAILLDGIDAIDDWRDDRFDVVVSPIA